LPLPSLAPARRPGPGPPLTGSRFRSRLRAVPLPAPGSVPGPGPVPKARARRSPPYRRILDPQLLQVRTEPRRVVAQRFQFRAVAGHPLTVQVRRRRRALGDQRLPREVLRLYLAEVALRLLA